MDELITSPESCRVPFCLPAHLIGLAKPIGDPVIEVLVPSYEGLVVLLRADGPQCCFLE